MYSEGVEHKEGEGIIPNIGVEVFLQLEACNRSLVARDALIK